MLECPECKGKTKVINVRTCLGATYRQRKCLNCGFTFFTEEIEIEDEKDDNSTLDNFIKRKFGIVYIRERNEYLKKYESNKKKHRIENGLCTRCGKRKTGDGYLTCEFCRESAKMYRNMVKKERKGNGG